MGSCGAQAAGAKRMTTALVIMSSEVYSQAHPTDGNHCAQGQNLSIPALAPARGAPYTGMGSAFVVAPGRGRAAANSTGTRRGFMSRQDVFDRTLVSLSEAALDESRLISAATMITDLIRATGHSIGYGDPNPVHSPEVFFARFYGGHASSACARRCRGAGRVALPPYGVPGAGGSMKITRRRAPAPLVLEVHPTRGRETDHRSWEVGAIVLVVDPASRPRLRSRKRWAPRRALACARRAPCART